MNCEKTLDALGMSVVYAPETDRCPVDWSLRLLYALRAAQCGHGVFCRDGARQLIALVEGIANGQARTDDLALVREISEAMAILGCTLSAAVGKGIADTLSDPVWEEHARRKRCAAGVCRGLLTPYIDPELCNGCGECKKACTSRAIAGAPGMIHVLDSKLCRNRAACEAACPVGAIKRAATLPPLPTAPVPVGSFKAAPAAGKGLKKGLGLKKPGLKK